MSDDEQTAEDLIEEIGNGVKAVGEDLAAQAYTISQADLNDMAHALESYAAALVELLQARGYSSL